MRLADGLKNLSHEWIAAIIAHELGHALGLTNVGTDCLDTIMQGHNPGGCEPIVKAIHAADVDAARKHVNDRNHCEAQSQPTIIPNEPQTTPTPTPTPCFGDGMICYWDADCCNNSCDPWSQTCQEPQEGGCTPETCPGQCFQGFCTQTPVVIDVLGNGFDLTSLSDGVNFDLNADGSPERLAWTSAGVDDAWLALDRNHDGIIGNGSELFGEFAPQGDPPIGVGKNGFLALLEYDKVSNGGNRDGVLDRTDAIFLSLRLWQDNDHNGVSEAAELHTLPSLNIAVLELDYKISNKTDEHGNWFRYRAKVKDSKGSQVGRWAWDVFLITAP